MTHALTYLPQTDNIFVLKDGEISESGDYQELLSKQGSFAEFLIQYLQEANTEEDDLDAIKQQLENTIVSEELRDKLERGISVTRTRSESSDGGSIHGSQSISRQLSDTSETSELRRRNSDKNKSTTSLSKNDVKEKDTLIEKEKSETGSVKWEVYKHYLKSIGVVLSLATVFLNIVFQGFSIGSNLWLVRWSTDRNVVNDTGLRDMYLGVYGALGIGQGKSFYAFFHSYKHYQLLRYSTIR